MVRRNIAIVFIAGLFLLITPHSLAADTQPPKLVDWTLVTEVSDNSKVDAQFTVRFIISDESQVEVPNLLLKSNSTSQMTSFAQTTQKSKSGNLYSFESVATVKIGQAPRQWQWVLYPLRDALGNTDNSFGPSELWQKEIVVVNSEYTRANVTCEKELSWFNRALDRFFKVEASKPNFKYEFDVLRLKFDLPPALLSTKVCDSEPAFSSKYANLVAGLSDAMTVALERIRAQEDLQAQEKAKAEAEAKAKAEAEAKAKADAEAKAKAEAAMKKISITCVKGKLIKKVTAINPKCPSGYKKK